jgi:CheY-like chemotaxis protein
VRILLIEDSDSIRSMIETLMEARGHEVVAVSNGAKGLEEAMSHPPDAILLDLSLPGSFDGYDVCERIRGNASTRHIPIMVISAMADNESKQRAMDKGASAFYTKPFSPLALLKELESLGGKPESVPKLRV